MAKTTSKVTQLHAAVKRGDLAALKALLEADRGGVRRGGCSAAAGGTQGRWQKCSDATLED